MALTKQETKKINEVMLKVSTFRGCRVPVRIKKLIPNPLAESNKSFVITLCGKPIQYLHFCKKHHYEVFPDDKPKRR